ncbi:MAG: HAD-IA family hydrolase [Candidatus Thorarchaeota archaeon]
MVNTALVVSANFKKSYPIVRSLAKGGYEVIIALYSWKGPVFSKYANSRFKILDPAINESEYISEIVSISKKCKPSIIIPVGFIDNLIIAKYRSLISPTIKIPIPSYRKILEVSDKRIGLSKISKATGVKIPRIISSEDLKKRVKSEKPFLPVVVKGTSDGSLPSYVFNGQILKEFSYEKPDSVVQDFINGYGCGYFALAKDGKPFAEFGHRRILEKSPSGGPSVVACSYDDPLLFRAGRKIVDHLKWSGVIMAEFKRDEETGEYYLIEINPKFWGSLELSIASGVDFPRYLADLYVLDKKPNFRGFRKENRFSWIIDGMHYLRDNYHVWLKLLKYGICDGSRSTDLHLNDPADLLLSLMQNFGSLIVGKKKFDYSSISQSKMQFKTQLKTQGLSHILFDLDGTLTNLNIEWRDVRKELTEIGIIRKWDSVMMSFCRLKRSSSEEFDKLNHIVEQYELRAIKNIRPDNSLRNLLAALQMQGVAFALISKQSKRTINAALAKVKLSDFFKVVVGREDQLFRHEQIQVGLNSLKANLRRTLFIGDTVNDATAAAKVGVTPIAVSTNHYLVQSFYELGVPCFKSTKVLLTILLKKKHIIRPNQH